MENTDVIIVGGGLAGLTAAIHLARKGISVMLFEKEKYPRHKVCGEYLSREVLPYLEELEIPINTLNPNYISKLLFSTTGGKSIETSLPLGGLGVSRYVLDELFYTKALENGAVIKSETVTAVEFDGLEFAVLTSERKYISQFVLGAFGKRSNLDKALKRGFFNTPAPWIAVKSHYHNTVFKDDTVALHNFKGGYCGLSRTESQVVNVCYLATYESFKKHKNPEVFQREVLQRNPFLDSFFNDSKAIFQKPLTIAQVSFESKARVKNHLLFLGDAAGLIHPLSGNGMAMAIHSAKIASELVLEFTGYSRSDRSQLEKEYSKRWKRQFGNRIQIGKILQRLLLNQNFADISQLLVSKIPIILPELIKRTHGQPIT